MSAFSHEVERELVRARDKHPPIRTMHEGYAVILEELDEFWEHVRGQTGKRNIKAAYLELVQIAAMCERTAEDIMDDEADAPPSEPKPPLMPDDKREGFVAQAMWDEPEREWFDVAPMVKTALDAAKILEEAGTNFEKYRHRPECVRRGILATRIMRRSVLDEPWPDRPPLPTVPAPEAVPPKPRRMKANPRVPAGSQHAVEHDKVATCSEWAKCEPVDAPGEGAK